MHPVVAISQHTAELVSSASISVVHAIRGGAFFNTSNSSSRQRPPQSKPKRASSSSDKYDQLVATWFQVSQPIRFFVSGNIGNVLLFYFERIAYYLLNHLEDLPQFVYDYKDSVSFFMAYICILPTQHYLNAILVFGYETISTREKYLKTLFAQTNVYLFALFGSTILNTILMKTFQLNKTITFCLTLWVFACFNYIVINYLVWRTTKSEASNSTKRRKQIGKSKAKKVSMFARGGGSGGGRGQATAFISYPQILDGEEQSSSLSSSVSRLVSRGYVHEFVVATEPVVDIDESICDTVLLSEYNK